MKIIKTDKYRVKIENPWLTKGDIFNKDVIERDVEDYPQVFEALYQFEGYDKYFALFDIIYRIATKGYEDVVKSVAFTEAHVNNDIGMFPTKELAEQFLAEKESKRTEKYSQQSIYQALECISLFSSVNINEKTIQEIQKNLNVINEQASNALKQLKNG